MAAATLIGADWPAQPVRVFVGDQQVVLHRHNPTVSDALAAAHVSPRAGALLSVVTRRVLEPDAHPGTVWRGSTKLSLTDSVQDGDRLIIRNGLDQTESLVQREETVPGGGRPAVETTLLRPPVDGVALVSAGERSGEVVSHQMIKPPIPATPETDKIVALTFDDGPDPRFTPQILRTLNAEGVKATFCLVASAGRRHASLVKAIADAGHELCDHTEHHVEYLNRRPRRVMESEIASCAEFITEVSGRPPPLYRAPGGTLSPEVIDVAHRQGMRVLGWSVDPSDYRRPPAPAIVQRVLRQVRPGAIILSHDGGGDRSHTVQALPVIIGELKAQGYSFATP